MLDKLMAAFGAKQKEKVVEVDEALKAKLKGLVYDDELVDELLPIFSKLKQSEGFDQVMTLLESKEAQIEAIASGDAFKQQTTPEHVVSEEEDPEQSTAQPLTDAAAILAQRFKQSV